MPKARLVGLKLTAGAVGATPVPVRGTVSGLSEALVTVCTLALRAPVACGVKLTLMRQLLPALSVDPQLVLSPKSPGFVPVRLIDVMVRLAVPVFCKVIDLVEEVVPTV